MDFNEAVDFGVTADSGERMDFDGALDFLEQRSGLGSVMGLDSIRNLLRELSDPQKDLEFVHIAGTNGKGSVSACLSSILKEAGCRTGTYTSPAVISVRERYQVDGSWITEREFALLADRVKAAAGRMEEKGRGIPTVFEIETAMAFLYFKEKGCRVVVLETGLGGEQDATNVVENTLAAVFTSISMDHMGVLGNTLGQIAACKAGIIKPGCEVVSAHQPLEVLSVLKDRAGEKGCVFTQVDLSSLSALSCPEREENRGEYAENVFTYKAVEGIRISLPGTYQLENGALALEAASALSRKGIHIPESAMRKGLSNVSWPGRFQMLKKSPMVIVDGAHNRDAALRLRECVETCLAPDFYYGSVWGQGIRPDDANHGSPGRKNLYGMAAGPRQKPESGDTCKGGRKILCRNAGSGFGGNSLGHGTERRRRAGSRTGLWLPVLSGADYEGDRKEEQG